MTMPMEIGPDRRVGIEVFPPPRIAQHRPVAFRDHNRFGLQPVAHLREGVPDVTMIESGELIHGRGEAPRAVARHRPLSEPRSRLTSSAPGRAPPSDNGWLA